MSGGSKGQGCGFPMGDSAGPGSRASAKPVVMRQELCLTLVPSTGLILTPPMAQHPVPRELPSAAVGAVPYGLLAALLLAGVVEWALDVTP